MLNVKHIATVCEWRRVQVWGSEWDREWIEIEKNKGENRKRRRNCSSCIHAEREIARENSCECMSRMHTMALKFLFKFFFSRPGHPISRNSDIFIQEQTNTRNHFVAFSVSFFRFFLSFFFLFKFNRKMCLPALGTAEWLSFWNIDFSWILDLGAFTHSIVEQFLFYTFFSFYSSK